MNAILVLLLCAAVGVAGYVVGLLRARRALGGAVEQARRDAAAAEARLDAERRHAAEARDAQAQALRSEFRAVARDLAQTEGQTLRAEHLHLLEAQLGPLGKSIESFREQFVAGHAAMDRYVKDLMERAEAVGREAGELAQALRGNNKLQGNWGEAVLGNLLDAAGLTRGRDYDVQYQTHDDAGRRLIPDVVVRLPGGRAVIVDSKVSLTAYVQYATAEAPAEQERQLREHVASVRRHIKELSQKDYGAVVPGSIGYVLMFIPGEAPYAAALAAAPQLPAEAYADRVILVNPTNLLMALQLAHNLWQSDLQRRSVGEIYASAEKLYKKFALFAQNFVQMGRSVRQLSELYDKAERQLHTGRGNIVSQLEGWKKKGLTPGTDIPEALRTADDDGPDALPPDPDAPAAGPDEAAAGPGSASA